MKKINTTGMSACRKQVQILISACLITFLFINNAYSQAGEKYSTGGNTLGISNRLGSNNYTDLNIYTNSNKVAVFTKDGLLDQLGESHFRKNSVFDSLLTAFAIRVQAIQANSLTVIYNAQIDGLLTVGNTLNFDGTNQTISSTTGIINFSNNTLTTTGKITADTINTSGASISNLTAGNITATAIQTQTINTGELLINGLPPQIGDTINVNVVNAGNIVIDGTASQIYSTNGVIDFNNNNIKNVGKLTVSQLGINTPNPIASMQVSGTDELNTTIGLIRYSDDDRSSRLSFVKYRGTMANPKSVLSGDRLGIISYHGFDGVQFQSSDMIKGVATENFNPSGRGSKIEFSTTPNGSTTDHIALILDNDQTARFANTVYAPNIVISDKIITKEAEFDSLRINEKLYATGSFNTDTVHALKQISVNNTLQVEKQDTTNYAEIFTKSESSLYIQSKEGTSTEKNTIINAYTGKVGIGTTDPSGSEKLTVVGNTRLQGDVNVSGAITANTFNTDNLEVLTKIRTKRISPLIGDSLIYFGDSSLVYNDNGNQLGWTTTQIVKGGRFGNGGYAVGLNSVAIGHNVGAWDIAENAITIGSGGSTFLSNDIPNSLMIGFNSNIPTLTVSSSNGVGTTGNVGIGTKNPQDKLDVVGNIRVNDYDIRLRSSSWNGNHGLGWYGYNVVSGNPKLFASTNVDGPVLYGYNGGALGSKYTDDTQTEIENIALRWTQDGNVGIGTNNPSYGKLQIQQNGHADSWEYDEHPLTICSGFYPGEQVLQLGADRNLQVSYLQSTTVGQNVSAFILNPRGGRIGIGAQYPYAQLHIESNSTNGLYLNANNGNGMFIKVNNDVSVALSIISGNTENVKIRGNGEIFARRIKVMQGSFFDFVFEDNYNLLSLVELKEYININHKLPDIPSEKNVIENGLDIGEINCLLVKKIEELTLYVIQLNEEIEKLKNENGGK